MVELDNFLNVMQSLYLAIQNQNETIERQNDTIKRYSEREKEHTEILIGLQKNIKEQTEKIQAQQQELNRLYSENAKMYREHIQDKTVHKQPLDNNARAKSLSNRQANAEDTKISVLRLLEGYVWHFYQTIIQQGDREKYNSIRVDMQVIMNKSGVSEKTIRDIIRQYEEGQIQINFSHQSLDIWLQYNKTQRFKNVKQPID
jgi:hypothetical protein